MIENKLSRFSNYIKVQPCIGSAQPILSRIPHFNKEGRPIEYLNWNFTTNKIITNNVSVDDKFYHQD